MAPAGQHVLADAVVMIGMWIIKPVGIPFAISSLFFVAIALINKIPGDKIFVGFTGNALWVLISALFFGYILITTGLGKRLAYLVISGLSRIWQPSYLTLMIAWVIIGVLLSFLTASIAVRVSIVTPIAISFLEACKIEPRSRGAALLLLTAWFCAMLPGSGLLTGALYGPIIQGMFNGEASLHGIIDYASWLEVMLLPITIISVITVMGGYFFFKPKEELQIDSEYFVTQYKALGPLSRKEAIAAVIFAVTFLFYLTASYHHIPDVIICLGGELLFHELSKPFCPGSGGNCRRQGLATERNKSVRNYLFYLDAHCSGGDRSLLYQPWAFHALTPFLYQTARLVCLQA